MTDLYLGDFVMNGSRRGISLIEVLIVVVILTLLAAIIVPPLLDLPGSSAPTVSKTTEYAKSVASISTRIGNGDGSLFSTEHDGHLFVVYSNTGVYSAAGGLEHHPDCACLKGVGDE